MNRLKKRTKKDPSTQYGYTYRNKVSFSKKVKPISSVKDSSTDKHR